MIVDRARNDRSETTEISGYEVVPQKSRHLGAIITDTRGCEEEIGRHLAIATVAMTILSTIWKDTCRIKATKLKLVNVVIFPLATYVSETWSIKNDDA